MQYDVRFLFLLFSMSWFLTNLIATFLLPPLNLLLLGWLGIALWHKRPLLARVLVTAALLLLWVFATPFVAGSALRQLEGPATALDTTASKADAIVVLGGGTYFQAPEYGGDTVGESTLVRLRYAAQLQRQTAKPILVTGGKPLGNETSEAQQMKAVLANEFKVPVQWTEDASDNTRENAQYSYQLLSKLGIKRIYLVTHAWHMPRARRVFEQAGFEVIPSPTAFTRRDRTDLLSFLPNATALRDSGIFVHESIGLLWYRLKSAH